MRGTKYLETDITIAYGNKKAFDNHQIKLREIQAKKRNPFTVQKKMSGIMEYAERVRKWNGSNTS